MATGGAGRRPPAANFAGRKIPLYNGVILRNVTRALNLVSSSQRAGASRACRSHPGSRPAGKLVSPP
jgi:hypothetical protein